MSHPIWVRGLKHVYVYVMIYRCVAPYMGAWIETAIAFILLATASVAPYMGAWIETHQNKVLNIHEMSHPIWVRGLKQIRCYRIAETAWSHPIWVRGLKLVFSLLTDCFLRRTLYGCVD